MLYGTFFIFFAYGGFARVSVVAEEVKDAKRNVPRACFCPWNFDGCLRFGWVSGCGVAGSVGLAASSSPLSAAIGVTGNSLGSSNHRCWRFSGYGKRFVDSDFGGFPHGLFDGTTQRFALCLSSVASQVFDTLLRNFGSGHVDGDFGFVCGFDTGSGN